MQLKQVPSFIQDATKANWYSSHSPYTIKTGSAFRKRLGTSVFWMGNAKICIYPLADLQK